MRFDSRRSCGTGSDLAIIEGSAEAPGGVTKARPFKRLKKLYMFEISFQWTRPTVGFDFIIRTNTSYVGNTNVDAIFLYHPFVEISVL